ncbi:hypothetical protein DH2020_011833 [Rehmannia glutinosa]|uniref:NAD(P)H dehydrogenase subunit CRR3, chloroplastic n=1 Tax=Rehmannia glutinosa TaxID=99300 RepID=A0ABR0VG91_REHGL
MAILNCNSITRPQILASSALPNDSSPSTSNHAHLKPNRLPKQNYKKIQEKLKQKQEQQPSILEIERAIGAGIFRDSDTNRQAEREENSSLFGNILRNSVGENEGSVEKQLRETGEWLIDQTERTSRSAGKQILITMFVWIMPMWIFAFLVAAGVVHLPFSTPFLDDLIS